MLGVQRYDCGFFNPQFQQECINDIERLFQIGLYKSYLPEQSQDILFTENINLSENWNILKNSFLESVFHYSGQKFHKTWAWCFRNQENIPPKQWNWHFHPNALFSGVLYLNLPSDERGNFCYTTEFKIDNDRSMFVEPVVGSWFIFHGKHVHRNGFWNHLDMKGNRYCIAASVA